MNLTAGAALHKGKYLLTYLGHSVLTLNYHAIDTDSGQTVVIKTLAHNLRQHSKFDQFKQQFLELAERWKSCKHPNLVQVLDTFEDAGCPYIVMEYLPGQTLAQLIQTEILSEATALDYIRQVGKALITLHNAGLLHQDVKPQNIIWRPDTKRIVLTEFGVIRAVLPKLKQTPVNLLSVGYAPLEQYFLNTPLTPAADIYSLAATLYTLLYRNPPLSAPVRQQLQTDGGQGDRFSEQNSQQVTTQISPRVQQAIWQGLEINAQKRPQTVEAWLSLLEQTLTPQSSLQECLITQAQPRSALKQPVKPIKANPTTSEPSMPNNTPTSRLSSIRFSVTKLQTMTHYRDVDAIKLNLIDVREAVPLDTDRESSKRKKWLLKALLMTGAIAAAAGIGFGFALRFSRPNIPGSTIFHTKQSFPPKSN